MWRDINEGIRRTYLTTSLDSALLRDQIQLYSNATWYASHAGPLVGPTRTVNLGLIRGVQDRAVLYWTFGRLLVPVFIPAPVQTIFMADWLTVDQFQIVDLIAVTTIHLRNTLFPEDAPDNFVVGYRLREPNYAR